MRAPVNSEAHGVTLDCIELTDCFEGLKNVPDGSVDLIASDPPYGTTDNDWDTLPDFEKLFAEFRRVLKPTGTVVFTCVFPFAAKLIVDNADIFKYDMVWEKNRKTDFANAKNKPLRRHENILVFSKGTCANRSLRRMAYNPQGLEECKIAHKAKVTRSPNYGKALNTAYTQTQKNYPDTVLSFPCVQHTVHPTQKPEELFEWIIRTFSNEGDTVLDPFVGSGTTAVCAKRLGRHYVGFEMDAKYHAIACARISECMTSTEAA